MLPNNPRLYKYPPDIQEKKKKAMTKMLYQRSQLSVNRAPTSTSEILKSPPMSLTSYEAPVKAEKGTEYNQFGEDPDTIEYLRNKRVFNVDHKISGMSIITATDKNKKKKTSKQNSGLRHYI